MNYSTEDKRSEPLHGEPGVSEPHGQNGQEFAIFHYEIIPQWKSLFCLRLADYLRVVKNGVPKSGCRFQIVEIEIIRLKFPVKVKFGIWMKSC